MNAHDYRPISPDDDQWIKCSQCSGWMMPLAKAEIEDSDWEPRDEFGNEYQKTGWGSGTTVGNDGSVLDSFFGTFWQMFVDWRRRRKLERLKAEVLPTHPKSQVCPKCLRVKRLA